MSAIAGVVRPSGAKADDQTVSRMLAAMAHRAPQGRRTASEGPAALGHGLLATTILHPAQPMPLSMDGITLSADIRLDNPDELIETLGLPADAPEAMVAIAAYRRWGDDFALHLLGDFAIALWDAGKQRLLCVRDHFGVKPFYYHASAASFLFASEIKGLFASGDVPRDIDEARVADFLIAIVQDKESTLYTGVKRLPPGSRLTVDGQRVEVSTYWKLEAPPQTPRRDAAEAFRALFERSVARRLRSEAPVGAFLSGGLDSSSIACMAARLRQAAGDGPLPTLSLTFDRVGATERPYVEAVLAQGGFDPLFLTADDYQPFADFETTLAEQEGPFLAPGLSLSRLLYRTAASKGLTAILDGHGGDEVISYGLGRLQELAAAGRLSALWRETRGVSAIYGDPALPTFLDYVGRSPYGALVSPALRVGRKIGSLFGRKVDEPRRTLSGFLNPDLVRRTQLAQRYEAQNPARISTMTERERHLYSVDSAFQTAGFEVLDRVAGAAGVEPRYPFWDKALVEFCLSLPADEKLRDGWTRSILRRGMDGVLPPQVRDRRDKYDFTPQLAHGMLLNHADLINGLLNGARKDLAQYVDVAMVQETYQRMLAQGAQSHPHDINLVSRATILAQWLSQQATAGGR